MSDKGTQGHVLHGVAEPSHYEPGRGWVRRCLCGREFVSYQDWQHVPALYDHLAIVGARERRLAALVSRESRRSVTGSLPGRVCVTDGTE
jgi:hypothetical protein